jgi:hypothetical protein
MQLCIKVLLLYELILKNKKDEILYLENFIGYLKWQGICR